METKKEFKQFAQTNEIKTSKNGTKENETRATFIVNEELLEKLKAIAYWERCLIKDVINEAIEDYLNKYEKKNRFIKPSPERLNNVGAEINGVKFYTIPQIADAFNVTPKTIRTWIQHDKLKGKKIGKITLITENNLMQFLDANY